MAAAPVWACAAGPAMIASSKAKPNKHCTKGLNDGAAGCLRMEIMRVPSGMGAFFRLPVLQRDFSTFCIGPPPYVSLLPESLIRRHVRDNPRLISGLTRRDQFIEPADLDAHDHR